MISLTGTKLNIAIFLGSIVIGVAFSMYATAKAVEHKDAKLACEAKLEAMKVVEPVVEVKETKKEVKK